MVRWREVRSWLPRRTGRDRDASQPGAPDLRSWVSTLSSPWVEVLVLGDHVMISEDGQLIADGSILALPLAVSEQG